MEEIWIYKSKLLQLSPCTNIINTNDYVQIHSTTSSHNVSNLIGSTGQLYLELIENATHFSLIQEAKRGKSANAVVLAKIPKNSIDKCVVVCAEYPRQFKLAGIEVFYQIQPNGRLTLDFYVKTEGLIESFEDAENVLSELCRINVATTINEFFNKKTPKLFPKFEHFCATYSDNSDTSSSNFQQFFDELEKCTKQWNVTDDYEIQDKYLNCQLMQYQRKTVKWMIERELKPDKVDLTSLLYSVQIGSIYYYPVLGVFTKTKVFDSICAPKGGILADEMGLGKTVEILSLIVSNRKDKDENDSKSKVTPTQKHLDWAEYKSAKVGKMKSAAVYTATTKAENMKIIKCAKCGDKCDMEKCGWKAEFEKDGVDFWCPQCMATKTPLEVKTTLIVLPESLIVQWYNEISKHCSQDLKIMFYFGLKSNGYLHPCEIAKYDIILATYKTLSSDFQFSDFKNAKGSRMEKCHKFSPTSINHVKWWRVISDESQLIEGALSKAGKMFCIIEAHNRWTMTGTPIVHSISDLGGLFRNIGLWPFSVQHFWEEHVVAEFHQMCNQNHRNLSKSRLVRIAGQVMRRNTKKMVEDEMTIPNLVQIDKFVDFPRIEESQYRKEMEQLKRVVGEAIRDAEDDWLLKEMKGKNRVLVALGKLKETLISCGEHTNLSKSKNANEAVISDPKNVIFRLIKSKKSKIGEKFRIVMTTLIHLSEGNWLMNNMAQVLHRYEKISEIVLMIEDLNKFFDRFIVPEDVEDEDLENKVENSQPALKSPENVDVLKRSNRKRNNEEEEDVPPTKVPKLEVKVEKEETDEVKMKAEKKARMAMKEMRKGAIRPILADPIMSIRFIEGLNTLKNRADTREISRKIVETLGGLAEAETRKTDAYERFMSNSRKALEKTKLAFDGFKAGWPSGETYHGMLTHLRKIENWYNETPARRTSNSLVDGLMRDGKFTRALKELPFWPVFSASEQHFKDGKTPKTDILNNGYWRTQKHIPAECLGVCNGECLEVVAKNYKKSTNVEFLEKIREFIEKLESLRQMVFEGCEKLIDVVLEEDGGRSGSRHGLLAEHNVCGDETRLVMSRMVRMKCDVCTMLRTLAQLRFAVGCGSFHGQTRATSRTGIEDFYSAVVRAECKRDGRLDGSKELGMFNGYIAQLRRSTYQIQMCCDVAIEHINERRRVEGARQRFTIDDFRAMYDPENKKDDAQVKMAAIRERPGLDREMELLKAECQELRYLINVYEKERESLNGHGNNEREEEGGECPICWSDLDVFSIFPCGHRVCDNCCRYLCGENEKLNCVSCRKEFECDEVINGRERMEKRKNSCVEKQSVVPGLKLSVKLEATIELMREILKDDGVNNKIILFTTLDYGQPIWRFLVKVLQKAKLPFVEVTRVDYGKCVSSFEFSDDVKILLCSLSMCANGLNLTQANNIIFLDPTHLFSVVEQAIGRISRYGQKQEMKVYHMIVRQSIDEEIRKIVKSAKNDEKEGNDLTIGELRQIFGITRNND